MSDWTPWFVSGVRHKVEGQEWHHIMQSGPDSDTSIALVGYNPKTHEGWKEAHLIAAAPALAEALAVTLRCMDTMAEQAYLCGLEGSGDWDKVAGGGDLHGARDTARAAFAKARGEG